MEEVFRARRIRHCRERALVLTSLGIPHAILREGGDHLLCVPESHAEVALAELAIYERENRGWPPRTEDPPAAASGAWQSTVLYAALLVVAFFFQRGDAFGWSWLELGDSWAEAIRGGETWRAATSLTLHADVVHLLGNLVYGALFGYMAAHSLGGGSAWLAILAGGVLGNLTNAWIQPPGHHSIGASTAVFAAIGILTGSEIRRRQLLRERRMRRAVPILVALVLFSYLGLGELEAAERTTDVLAHATGLAWGLPLGWLTARLADRFRDRAGCQLALGTLALAFLGASWLAAATLG